MSHGRATTRRVSQPSREVCGSQHFVVDLGPRTRQCAPTPHVPAHPVLFDRDPERTRVVLPASMYEAASDTLDEEGEAIGLREVSFGEYLVEQGVLDRFQLFRALQLQDRHPGVRLGECAAALGYAPSGVIERLFDRFQQLSEVMV
jgi:hypothetical protein